jgi:hypothetical protein
MTQAASYAQLTLALNTTLEREFVSPLTSIRGVLEIMRDFPDLTDKERSRFLDNALQDCLRLEQGIEHLASTVYAAADPLHQEPLPAKPEDRESAYAHRIRLSEESQIIDVDFSDFEFSSSAIVNDFYNHLDQLIENSGKRWYILANYRNCSIWPEAWVAFAHRGKKVNVSYSLGTVRYTDSDESSDSSSSQNDPETFTSREAALAHINKLRQT